MDLVSSAFSNQGYIPSQFTCDGSDVNPPLTISNAPTTATSLALIVDDPDAPAGTWTHWTIWNIDPKTKEITEHSVPLGAVEGVTSFDKVGWGGPCPPSGIHRYFFKLLALDVRLELAPGVSRSELERAIDGHVVARAELVGRYQRNK